VFWGKGIYHELPIVPIILCRIHYFGVRRNQPKQPFPELWAKDAENVLVVTSTLNGRKQHVKNARLTLINSLWISGRTLSG